jgi:hypothetical protein
LSEVTLGENTGRGDSPEYTDIPDYSQKSKSTIIFAQKLFGVRIYRILGGIILRR